MQLQKGIYEQSDDNTSRYAKLEEKKKVRVGNMGATMVLRCLSEPESEADLRSVKIAELAQKLTEIATFFQ